MRLIGAEIKRSPPVTSPEPLQAAGHVLTLDREQLRVYELVLDPGQSTGEIDYRFSSLTVMLTIATLRIDRPDGADGTMAADATMIHAPGDVIWRPGPTTLAITNVGETPCRAAVGEWR